MTRQPARHEPGVLAGNPTRRIPTAGSSRPARLLPASPTLILALVTLSLLWPGLWSCSQGNAAVDERVSLLHYFTGSLSAGIAQLAEKVNAEHQGLVLEATPMEHEQFKNSIRVQLEGPNPPDLFSYWAGAKALHLVRQGSVQPLDGLIGSTIPASTFPPVVLGALMYDGKPYMIPITQHFVGFFFNSRVFREAGLAAPADWDSFLAACATLKAKGITPLALGAKTRWPAQFWFDYLLLREAGFAWRTALMEGDQPLDSLQVRQALTRWQAMLDQDWFNADAGSIDWDEAALRVAQGQCAMTLMGTWVIGTLGEKGYASPADYDFFAFPCLGLADENTALGPIDGVMLSAGSRHRQAALQALERLAQPAPQIAFSQAAGSIPPLAGVDSGSIPPLQQRIKAIMDQCTGWAFNFDLATNAARSEIGLDALLEFVKSPDNLDSIVKTWNSQLDQLD